MKAFLASLFIFLGLSSLQAQNGVRFLVSAETTFLLNGPGTNYDVTAELSKGMQVLLISDQFENFLTVQYRNMNGFIKRDDIIPVPVVKESSSDLYSQ